jgi:hypothetical protein
MKFKSIWDCEVSQDAIAPAGTVVVLPYVWSFAPDRLTPHDDIKIVLEHDATYGEALALVEQAAFDFVWSRGAEDMRQYYIESVEFENGVLTFHYGT